METLSQKLVTTRKPHQCWGCEKVFPAGTKLSCVTTADGGEFNTVYWCARCQEVLQEHGEDIDRYDDGLLLGEVAEYEREYLCPAAEEPSHAK